MALDEDAFIKRIENYNKQLNIEFYGYDISDNFAKILENDSFYEIVKELIEFGISRYKLNYADKYKHAWTPIRLISLIGVLLIKIWVRYVKTRVCNLFFYRYMLIFLNGFDAIIALNQCFLFHK